MLRNWLFWLLLVSPVTMAASDETMDRLFQMSLEELLEITITSATRHEESLDSVPASVTVYTREQLRVLGINKLSQLMNFVPGFQSQRFDNASESFSFSSRAYAGSGSGREILILLDGQRLNSDWSGGVHSSQGLIDLDKIARIEFIRGPGSAIYGSNAYLGVINITSQAINESAISLATLNGSGTQTMASVQWQGDHEAWESELFVKTINDEGQKLRVFDPFKNDLVTTRDPYVFEEVYLKAKGNYASLAIYQSRTRNKQFYVSGFVSNGPNLLDAKTRFVDIKYQYPLSEQLQLHGNLSLSKKRFDIAGLISPALPPNELGIRGEIEEQEPLAEISLSYLGDEGAKALAGIEWRRPKIIDSDANLFGAASLYLSQAPLTHRTIYGLFAQYQGAINDQLHYVLGLRHDDYSNFGGHLSPRGGLVWDYSAGQTLKWLYGESFRAPSRGETDVQNSSAILGNPNLKPEVARTSELIWQTQEQTYFLATTLFYTELRDVISNAQTTPIERYNTGDESLAGLELEWHHQWAPALSSRFNTSWIFDGPNQVNSEAEFFSGLSLVYLTNHFSLAFMVNHHSTKQDAYVDNQVDAVRDIPQRSFINVHYRRFFPHDLELYFHLNNLSDEGYNSTSQRAGNNVGVPNRAIGFMTGLRWQY